MFSSGWSNVWNDGEEHFNLTYIQMHSVVKEAIQASQMLLWSDAGQVW